jgi:hypothetical protein
MKQTRSFFNKKPRPKGWKNVIAPVAKRTRVMREEMERDPVPKPLDDGEGYLLAPCCVLLAAVFGTRAAYEWAMEWLEMARQVDSRRFVP